MFQRATFFLLFTALASAQTTPDVDKRLADLDKAVKSAQSAGDNAWMLVSAALVLMMTGPGLALFYGGLVRRKNVLSTMMHSFILMAVVTVLWAVVGYSTTFGGKIPCFDFAGGTVVHITSGVSALVCALFLGPRKGYRVDPMRPHSLVLSTVGACLLWVGWFGFNAGSALASSPLATSAFVA